VSKKKRSCSGQALVEYMLLLALLSAVTFGFSNFFIKTVFGGGLSELPQNTLPLISHRQ